MGRLVTPMSNEEFDKLPEWQKWWSRNWWIFFAILFCGMIIVPWALFKFEIVK